MKISVAARSSLLSRAQVSEALAIIRTVDPQIEFDPIWVETQGDLDRNTSLRTLGKTDFFTREVDLLVMAKTVRLGIHSAKDLPDPMPVGLCIAAITQGVDPRDVLVLREGETLWGLESGAWIATSSERREEAVRSLRADLCFKDLRGTIAERLRLLETRAADGVVIAEAALIRLHLTHLNRLYLPGPTVEGQGKLAIVCREEDTEMRQLWQKI